MKKVIAIALCLVMIFVLAACGQSATDTSTNQQQSQPASTQAGTSQATTSQPASTSKDDIPDNYYKGKAVNWIIPWAAGGSTDVTSRALAAEVEKKLGCTIVVLNTQGGGGLVGYNTLIGASKDGFTVGSATSSMLLFKASGKANIGYDAADWLCMYVSIPANIVVPANSPFNTLDELVDYAKANPGEVTYSTSGFGNYCHAAMSVLSAKTGAEFTQVSYDSGSLAATAAAGGHVYAAACAVSESSAMVDSGDLKILAVIGDNRSQLYPDVPSTSELGYEGMASTYTTVCMPLDCPEEAVETFSKALEEVITSDYWVEYMTSLGNIPQYMGGDEFDAFLSEQQSNFDNLSF